MLLKKYIIGLVAVGSAATIYMTGCHANLGDIAGDIQGDLVAETTARSLAISIEDTMDAPGGLHGGQRLENAIAAWDGSLNKLNEDLNNLAKRIDKADADEKKDSRARMAVVQANLQAFLTLSLNKTFKMPPWSMNSGLDLARKADIKVARDMAKVLYNIAFDTAKIADSAIGTWDINFVVDTAIRDTYNDCVSTYSSRAPTADCQQQGFKYCTHQMDMKCINAAIAGGVNFEPLCYYEVIQKDAKGNIISDRFTYAAWAQSDVFFRCNSQDPIINGTTFAGGAAINALMQAPRAPTITMDQSTALFGQVFGKDSVSYSKDKALEVQANIRDYIMMVMSTADYELPNAATKPGRYTGKLFDASINSFKIDLENYGVLDPQRNKVVINF